jgi:hypothetical protein
VQNSRIARVYSLDMTGGTLYIVRLKMGNDQ